MKGSGIDRTLERDQGGSDEAGALTCGIGDDYGRLFAGAHGLALKARVLSRISLATSVGRSSMSQ